MRLKRYFCALRHFASFPFPSGSSPTSVLVWYGVVSAHKIDTATYTQEFGQTGTPHSLPAQAFGQVPSQGWGRGAQRGGRLPTL